MSEHKELGLFKQDIKVCTEYIKKTKALKFSLLVNLGYVIITIICFILIRLFMPLESTIVANDFRIFYKSAQTLLTEPEQLYTLPDYNMPFRYLPFFSILFIPYTFLPFELAFCIHTIILGVIQTISFYFVYIISTRFYNINFNNKLKSDLLYVCLMAPLQFPMMIMGQISHLFILLILLVIFLIENARVKRYNIKYEQFLIGFILGLSISFKPFSMLLIPLLIKLVVLFKDGKIRIYLKKLVGLMLGLFLSQIINLIYLILYPNILHDFLDINTSTQLFDYPSSSITRLISVIFNLFSFETFIMLILTLPLYCLFYSIYLFTPNKKINYPIYFSMIFLVVMITFTDSWFLNFLIWFTIVFPGLFQFEDEVINTDSEKLKKKLKITNYLIYRITYYGAVYFAVGVVIGWTIYPTDPIFPFFLIILFFLILWRLIRNRKKK